MNIYKVLPEIGKMQKWLKEREKDAKQEFGFVLKLDFAETNSLLVIDAVAKLVSDVLTVPINKMFSASREQADVEARHIVMHLCKKHIPNVHPNDLAGFFSKDRTTILNAFDRVEDLLSVADTGITEKIDACEAELLKRINE